MAYDALMEQIQELPPSNKEPLFRRLLVEDGLAYLREKDGSIIGFEADLDREQVLSGFTLIAIQKHTVFAYRSDLGEAPRLVLFPPLDKLFDQDFELLDLMVVKKRFTDSRFQGRVLSKGKLGDLVADLTPPQKQVDLPDTTVQAMTRQMEEIREGKQTVKLPDPPKEEEPPVEEPSFAAEDESFVAEEPFVDGPPDDFEEDPYAGFDESGFGDSGYEEYETYEEPEPVPEEEPEDERSRKLKAKASDFSQLSEVSEFCAGTLGVSRPLAVTVVNKALQSEVAPQYRIDLAVKLFCKLFDEKRI